MSLAHATAAPRILAPREPNADPTTSFHAPLQALHGDLFRRALFLSGGDRDLAGDLAQETIARALNAREQFVSGTNLRGWVMSILRNAFIDECRHRSHIVHDDQEIGSVPSTREIGPLDVLSTDDIQVALASLPARSREIFQSAHLDQVSYREIAQRLGISVGTVGTRLHRTRLRLRRALERVAQAKVALLQSHDGPPFALRWTADATSHPSPARRPHQ